MDYMEQYDATFRIVGEIADMLLLRTPEEKLLVDLSVDPPGHEAHTHRKYPSRLACTVKDADLIRDILGNLRIGAVVEVSGSLRQSDYIPHKTSHIDTTLLLTSCRRLKRAPAGRVPKAASPSHPLRARH